MLENLESPQVANMEFERKQNSGQLLQRLLEADKILRYKILMRIAISTAS